MNDSHDRSGPWRIPTQGGLPSSGTAARTGHGVTVGIPAFVCSNDDGGNRGGGDICPSLPEQCFTIYRECLILEICLSEEWRPEALVS